MFHHYFENRKKLYQKKKLIVAKHALNPTSDKAKDEIGQISEAVLASDLNAGFMFAFGTEQQQDQLYHWLKEQAEEDIKQEIEDEQSFDPKDPT